FFFYRCGEFLNIHSFPTRRSSDLKVAGLSVYINPEVPYIQNYNQNELIPKASYNSSKRPFECPEIILIYSLYLLNFGIHTIFYKDRKSTRLNSSHVKISYAVFCLK